MRLIVLGLAVWVAADLLLVVVLVAIAAYGRRRRRARGPAKVVSIATQRARRDKKARRVG